MGYSKAFLLLGLLLAIVLVISSQVSAKDLHNNKNAADPNGLNDAKYGGGGYQGDPGRGGYGGNPGRGGYGGNPGRGGYGGGPGHGRNGGGGYCYHGCCRRNYNGECRKCCDRAGQAVDAQPHH